MDKAHFISFTIVTSISYTSVETGPLSCVVIDVCSIQTFDSGQTVPLRL